MRPSISIGTTGLGDFVTRLGVFVVAAVVAIRYLVEFQNRKESLLRHLYGTDLLHALLTLLLLL